MTPNEAVNAIYQGELVECSTEDYPAVRKALQKHAGKMADAGDGLRTMMALEEVRRLDAQFKGKAR